MQNSAVNFNLNLSYVAFLTMTMVLMSVRVREWANYLYMDIYQDGHQSDHYSLLVKWVVYVVTLTLLLVNTALMVSLH